MSRAMREPPSATSRLFVARSEELAFLANALGAGFALRERRLRPLEAVRIAIAACSLGLELASKGGTTSPLEALEKHPADALFRAAWGTASRRRRPGRRSDRRDALVRTG